MTKTLIWHGCYDGNLKELIVKEAFAHPAKMSRRLAERILEHGEQRGYWKRGDTLLDPFFGVGTVGIIGAYRGYRVVGVELEKKFVELAIQNIDKNRRALESLGRPLPMVVQGDSRYLRRSLTGPVAGTVTSPPFTQGYAGGGGINVNGYGDGSDKVGERTYQALGGERAEGNIETMPVGVLTSPPWGEVSRDVVDAEARVALAREQGISNAEKISPIDMEKIGLRTQGDYGETEGQIGAMPIGGVTSPPYADIEVTKLRNFQSRFTPDGVSGTSVHVGDENKGYGDTGGQIGAMPSGVVTSPPFAGTSGGTGDASRSAMNDKHPGVFERHLGSMRNGEGYGESAGQINAMRDGDLAGVVGVFTSPPYGGNDKRDFTSAERDPQAERMTGAFRGSYGRADGQIGDMVTGELDGAITSPPYGEQQTRNGGDLNQWPGQRRIGQSMNGNEGYPDTEGQIGQMPAGGLTSPPYLGGGSHENQIGSYGSRMPEKQFVSPGMAGYGNAEGQIGQMPAGGVTSPPYADTDIATKTSGGTYGGDFARTGQSPRALEQMQNERYGETEGQLGGMSLETYWGAVAAVYAEVFALLPPGGVLAVVVKDYVKNGQIVSLCDQTTNLLSAIGFSIPERAHAMLVKERSVGVDMFTGEAVIERTERKSFFRRLHERKRPHLKIDWEEVIFAQKPL